MSFHAPNKYRVREGRMASPDSYGNNGAFILPALKYATCVALYVIVSDGEGWEHVSVSAQGRCPWWEEMCYVKGVFWDDEDTVMQLHPPRSQWVNCHPFALHLWRPIGQVIPQPPAYMVGPS